jgi:parallel beta-helix repeat protein
LTRTCFADVAGTVYIRADGSIDPPTAPILTVDNITYTLTGNIDNGILIERDNITVDGTGFSLDGETSYGIYMNSTRNVSIKNMRIVHFENGVFLGYSSNVSLSSLSISTSYSSIVLICSSWNSVSNSDIVANHITGIWCTRDPGKYEPVFSDYNRIVGNNITGGHDIDGGAVFIQGSYNIISGNNIKNSYIGIAVEFPSRYNTIFHNNFIDNTMQAALTSDLTTTWDVGLEGNYWSDYTAADGNQDGIGDTPYIIYENNTDHYPLMGTFQSFRVFEEVDVISNITISILDWRWWGGSSNQYIQNGQPFLALVPAREPNMSAAFCRMTLPNFILNTSEYMVLIDFTPINIKKLAMSNDTYTTLYFTFNSSGLNGMIIVPEFPSFLILTLFMVATILAIVIYRRRILTRAL